MKIVIIIVVVLLLAGGGGAGAYFMGMLDSLLGIAAVGEDGENLEDDTIEEAIYVQMDPFASPVIVNGRVAGQVILTISIQVFDTAARNDLAKVMPKIRDTILQSLYAQPLVRNADDGTIDIKRAKERLKAMLVGLLGDERVVDLLIVKAQQTR